MYVLQQSESARSTHRHAAAVTLTGFVRVVDAGDTEAVTQTNWMLAMLITSSCFTRTARPFHLSYRCLCTPQTGLPSVCRCVLSEVRHDVTTSAIERDVNRGWLYSSWLEVESVIWSPVRLRVCTAQLADLRGSVSLQSRRYATGCRSGLVNVGVYQTESSVAVAPRISFARAVS